MSDSPNLARPWVIGVATLTAAACLLLAERAYHGDFTVGPSLSFAGAAAAAAILVQLARKRRAALKATRAPVVKKIKKLKPIKGAATEDQAQRPGPVDQLLSEYFGIHSAETADLARRLLAAATADIAAKFAWRPARGIRGRFSLGLRNGKNPEILNLGTDGSLSRGSATMLDANGQPFQPTGGIQQILQNLSPHDLAHNPAMAALAATLATRYLEAMRSAVATSHGLAEERPGLPAVLEHLSQRVLDAQSLESLAKFKAMLDPDAVETMQKVGLESLAVYNYLAATDLFRHPDIAAARRDAVEMNPAVLSLLAGDPRFSAALDSQTAHTEHKGLPDWQAPNGLSIAFLPDNLDRRHDHGSHDLTFAINDRHGQTLSLGTISADATDTWQMTLHPAMQDAAIQASALEAAGAMAFAIDRGYEIAHRSEGGLGLFNDSHRFLDLATIERATHAPLPDLLHKPHFHRDFLHDFPIQTPGSLDFSGNPSGEREPDLFKHFRHEQASPRELFEAIERAQAAAERTMRDAFEAGIAGGPGRDPIIKIATDDRPLDLPNLARDLADTPPERDPIFERHLNQNAAERSDLTRDEIVGTSRQLREPPEKPIVERDGPSENTLRQNSQTQAAREIEQARKQREVKPQEPRAQEAKSRETHPREVQPREIKPKGRDHGGMGM